MNKYSILEPQPEEVFQQLLEKNVRFDGRSLLQSRKIVGCAGSIKNANGSTRVTIGKTVIECGIKGELTKPSAEEPGKGLIIPNVDLPALCSPVFKSGAPSEKAQTATKFLNNLIKCTGLIDLEELCIKRDILAWVLYCDIICFNYDGNLLDACVAALVMALDNVQLPIITVEDETNKITTSEEESFCLKLKSQPVSTTFASYSKYTIMDPTVDEEEMASCLVTYVVDQADDLVYSEQIGVNWEANYEGLMRRSLDNALMIRSKLYRVKQESVET